MLPPFDLDEPRTLPEALEVLANNGGDALPLAGGTNLLPDLRARRPGSRRFVSLAGVRELRRIDPEFSLRTFRRRLRPGAGG